MEDLTQTNIFIGFDANANQNVDLMPSSDENEDCFVILFKFCFHRKPLQRYQLYYQILSYLIDMSGELVKIETSQRSRFVLFINNICCLRQP